ncbi:hypothetical protein Acr_24g0008380 [Actinidia rufa]|uniref:Mitochondrial protein n=1 Tax=Actinidia rufa TaxID=165716 RepID=A0A7J0GV42_9ERIC|nr:hypothetical protein Acr_24g0008380 [Actinidia rufa]
MHTALSMKELGDVSYFLGISVTKSVHGYFLSQSKYALDILSKAGMLNCKSTASPISTKQPALSSSASFAQPSLYRSIVGALQYLTITRPNLAFAVNQVCQHMQDPSIDHFAQVKRILRYIQGTLAHGLQFTRGSFTLNAYVDSDWAGDPFNRRSTTGYCVFLGPNIISWSAKKQPTVARSSTEAEYIAIAQAAAELAWLRMLLTGLGINTFVSPTLWCDNLSTISLASNPVFHARTKYIEVDYHYIREQVVAKNLVLQHISSTDQVDDVLTKPLSSTRFIYLQSKLMVSPRSHLLEGGY